MRLTLFSTSLIALTLGVYASAETGTAIFTGNDSPRFCGESCILTKSNVNGLMSKVRDMSGNDASCPPPSKTEKNTDGIATGARKIMALMYGSCDVLKLQVVDELNPNGISKSATELVQYDSSGGGKTSKKKHGAGKHSSGFVRKGGKRRGYVRYIRDFNAVLNNHPYLHSRLGPGCTDKAVCSTLVKTGSGCEKSACVAILHPPLYQFGEHVEGRELHDTSSRYDHRRAGRALASGIDCSAYVSESMRILGYRFHPGEDVPEGGYGTGEIAALGSSGKNDCFNRSLAAGGMKPGDVIVSGDSHVVMVDTVGNDQFGLAPIKKIPLADVDALYKKKISGSGGRYVAGGKSEHIKALRAASLQEILDGNSGLGPDLMELYLDKASTSLCEENVDIRNFNITIAHSSSNNGSLGIQRQKIYPGLSSSLATLMHMKGIAECTRAIRKQWLAIAKKATGTSAPKVAEILAKDSSYALALAMNQHNKTSSVHVLRFDSTKEGCVNPNPPAYQNEGCVSCCSTKAKYSDLVKNAKLDNSGTPDLPDSEKDPQPGDDDDDGGDNAAGN